MSRLVVFSDSGSVAVDITAAGESDFGVTYRSACRDCSWRSGAGPGWRDSSAADLNLIVQDAESHVESPHRIEEL